MKRIELIIVNMYISFNDNRLSIDTSFINDGERIDEEKKCQKEIWFCLTNETSADPFSFIRSRKQKNLFFSKCYAILFKIIFKTCSGKGNTRC